MFRESKNKGAADTFIGQGTRAEGSLVSEGGLRIEGEYRGDIECKGDVIVGECGVARSNIAARDITIAGKVFGDVVTSGRLTLAASGQLHGNASAHTLLIQDGAVFNGSCRMDRGTAEEGNWQAPLETEPHPVQVRETIREGSIRESVREGGREFIREGGRETILEHARDTNRENGKEQTRQAG